MKFSIIALAVLVSQLSGCTTGQNPSTSHKTPVAPSRGITIFAPKDSSPTEENAAPTPGDPLYFSQHTPHGKYFPDNE